jgi:hypothetical protein
MSVSESGLASREGLKITSTVFGRLIVYLKIRILGIFLS